MQGTFVTLTNKVLVLRGRIVALVSKHFDNGIV